MRKVLVAEDCQDTQLMLVAILEKEGLAVICAENGERCLEIALLAVEQGTPYDLLLIDIQLPVLDGYSVAKQLRTQGYAGRIVAMSARDMLDEEETAIEAGCDAFVCKSVGFAGIKAVVRKQLL